MLILMNPLFGYFIMITGDGKYLRLFFSNSLFYYSESVFCYLVGKLLNIRARGS